MKTGKILFSIMIAASMMIASLQGQTVLTFTPSDDTFGFLNSTSTVYGTGTEIAIKAATESTTERQAALEFATPGVTPADITAVSLTLTLSQDIEIASEFRLWGVVNGDGIENFNETTANWNTFAPPFDTSGDGMNNGDSALFISTGIATATMDATAVAGDTLVFSSASNPNLLSFLKADNNGISTFLITRVTNNNSYSAVFASKENLTYDAPSLLITVPEPSSLSLMALALGGLYFLRRRQG